MTALDPKRDIDLNCLNCGRPMLKHSKYCFAKKTSNGYFFAWFAICGVLVLSVAAMAVYVAHHFIAKWW